MTTRRESFRVWLRRLTWPQKLGAAAGLAALVLGWRHLPSDPEAWKEWIEVAIAAGTGLATVAALVNGKESGNAEE